MAGPLETTPNPVHRRDVSALIGLLAILEGHLHDPDFADRPGPRPRPTLSCGQGCSNKNTQPSCVVGLVSMG